VHGLGDEVIGAVVLFEDISTIKDLERLRQEFAAMVVHDLRNAAQAITSQVALLAARVTDDEVRVSKDAIHRVERSAQQLAQLVGDLFETARIELSQLRLERRTCEVAEAIAAAVDPLRERLAPHPLVVEIEGAPPPISIDPGRFGQILGNLLDNAAKYSPDPTPIEVRARPAGGGTVITVTDRGPGIHEEDLARIFDRFRGSADPSRRAKVGLGLGLFIAKGLTEAHGGRIRVESEVGVGTVFSVWLPAAGAGE
jgi:signal transduction histidine kinase